MKRLVFLLCVFNFLQGQSQSTANAFSSFLPYDSNYAFGVNQGYYGGNWTSPNTAKLIRNLGGRTLRIPLYDEFLSRYGLESLVADFNYYRDSLGMTQLLAFVGMPSDSNRDKTVHGNAKYNNSFKGLYEPVWLDRKSRKINPANTYASYLAKTVQRYGSYVQFWEIVNEPDFTYSAGGWLGDIENPGKESWFYYDPKPEELYNLGVPFYYYVRMLRVAWEVIKTYDPSGYVCTGGIGYKSFLDAILRNTDNPDGGKVTKEYPLTGGAYFDVVSFHNYPMFHLRGWNNSNGGFVEHYRHSDAAVAAYLKIRNGMDSILTKHGYDGKTYPDKHFVCTETGVSARMNGTDWGSEEGQLNYMLKAQVASQANTIIQTWWFVIGDGKDSTQQFEHMGLYYFFGDGYPGSEKARPQGIASKTTSDLLYGSRYDKKATDDLKFGDDVGGGAFRLTNGKLVYVLWAKTSVDLSEEAEATYKFGSRKKFKVVEWNGRSEVMNSDSIKLTARPVFIIPH